MGSRTPRRHTALLVQRYAAYSYIQLYIAIHYTPSTSPLCYAPGHPWQPGHCLALRARRRRRGRCAPGRLHVLPALLRKLSPGGSGDVEDVVRCALLAREAQCKACFELLPRARVGWHTARTSVPPPPPRHMLEPERRCTALRWLSFMARGRRAGHAPPARRGRHVRVPRAFKRPARKPCGGWVVCGGGTRSDYFPLTRAHSFRAGFP
jgi:hypothetical protein